MNLTVESMMKEIVVVSGKGGVGKSSITASLAVLLNKAGVKVTAVDSDVDAPNLSIVLGTDITDFTDIKTSEKASINYERCKHCGRCVSTCKSQALIDLDGTPKLIPFLCEGCGACVLVCPTSAISIVQVANGRVGVEKTRYGFYIVSGQLNIGESNSGNIVTAVKVKGEEIAKNSGSDLILVDGPPGIGCPVIASISGADYAIAVTEPTPAASNSLDRIFSILDHFHIPKITIINKYDLNPTYAMKMIKRIQKRWKVPVIQIPFDENVPLSLSKRIPVVEFEPKSPSSEAINIISNHIVKAIL